MATNTSPYRSTTANGASAHERGGSDRPVGPPSEGTATQDPSAPKHHPWYAHWSTSSTTRPWLSGANRWGHRSASTTGAPANRTTTQGSPTSQTRRGSAPTSTLRATGCQQRRRAGWALSSSSRDAGT